MMNKGVRGKNGQTNTKESCNGGGFVGRKANVEEKRYDLLPSGLTVEHLSFHKKIKRAKQDFAGQIAGQIAGHLAGQENSKYDQIKLNSKKLEMVSAPIYTG